MTCDALNQLAAVAAIMERDVTMADLILEQLQHLRGMQYLPPDDAQPFDLVEWVDEGGFFDGLAFSDDVHTGGTLISWAEKTVDGDEITNPSVIVSQRIVQVLWDAYMWSDIVTDVDREPASTTVCPNWFCADTTIDNIRIEGTR